LLWHSVGKKLPLQALFQQTFACNTGPMGAFVANGMPTMMSMSAMGGMGDMSNASMLTQPTVALAVEVQRVESLPEVEHKLRANQLAMLALYQVTILIAQVGRQYQNKDNKPNEWSELTWQMDGMASVLIPFLVQGGKVSLANLLQAQLVHRFRCVLAVGQMAPESIRPLRVSIAVFPLPWTRDGLPQMNKARQILTSVLTVTATKGLSARAKWDVKGTTTEVAKVSVSWGVCTSSPCRDCKAV
jgi:hypothetical protein